MTAWIGFHVTCNSFLTMAATKKRQVEECNPAATVSCEAIKPRVDKKPQVVSSRLSGKSLNLWVWTTKEKAGPDDSFEGLMALIKEHSSDIEVVDVGAELWNQFNPEEIEQTFKVISELPNLRWLQLSLRKPGKDTRSKSLAMSTVCSIVSNVFTLFWVL